MNIILISITYKSVQVGCTLSKRELFQFSKQHKFCFYLILAFVQMKTWPAMFARCSNSAQFFF